MAAYGARMKKEQVAFGARLREALGRARLAESPKELADLVASQGGEIVTLQAAHSWIRGKSIPRRRTLRALADLLDVSVEWLLGEETTPKRRVGEPAAGFTIEPRDRLAVDAYLALPPGRRKLVRELIAALSMK